MGKEGDFTDDIDRLKSNTSSKISLDISGGLQNPEYIEEMISLLTIEKEKSLYLRSLLIRHEYNLQFYRLLILYFRTLIDFTSMSQISQNNSDLLIKPIVILLKSKAVLLDNEFVRKIINYEITRVIKFLVWKRQITRMLVTKVNLLERSCSITLGLINVQEKVLSDNKHMTKESIDEIMSNLDSAMHRAWNGLAEVSSEVHVSLRIINSLKESFIPSIPDILESDDILNGDYICDLIQRSFDISSIDMIPIKILVKHIILGKNVKEREIISLLYRLKNTLKGIYSKIAQDSIKISECEGIIGAFYAEMEACKKMALNFKPCLEYAIPTQRMCNMCKIITEVLTSQFNLVNKEIEFFFNKVLTTCRKKEYCKLKERVVKYICDEQVKSAHSSIQMDYYLDEKLSTNEEIGSKILSLCLRRDIIVNRMDRMRKLCASIKASSDVLVDFFLDDTSDDLLEQSDYLKNIYKCIKRNVSLGKQLDSSVVVILKQYVDFIDSEIPILEETLIGFLKQRKHIYSSSTTFASDSNVSCCFDVKFR